MTLTFRRFDLKLRHTWAIASDVTTGGKNFYPVVFVELEDGQGRRGVGEGAPSSRYKESTDTVIAFLRRVEASRLSFDDVAGSMAYLESVAPGNYPAKTAVNLALLDGAAKAARKSVCEFLNLGFTEGRHVTSLTIGIDRPEMVRQKVREAEDFPVLKVKLGSPDDRALFAAVREVAPHKPIRVDANEGWPKKEDALHRIEWLAAEGNVQFVEQPMPAASDPNDLAWLKARSPLPLFGDESYHHPSQAALAAECFHGVNVKLVKTTGLSGGLEALRAARQLGLKTMLGCMIESSVLISAAAHLAELTDYLDLDGNVLITNDPFRGVRTADGLMSFAGAPELFGLRVQSADGSGN
ncbi:MAG: dipeptide epimerase [Verrucomicrobia bacterium]|nr:dipeptide epimerase [Verrucomicrobiota bacterium]